MNINENIYTASIAKRLHVCESSKSRAGQILYCTALRTVRHWFNIYTSIPLYTALALWCRHEHHKLVTCFGITKGLRKHFWKSIVVYSRILHQIVTCALIM